MRCLQGYIARVAADAACHHDTSCLTVLHQAEFQVVPVGHGPLTIYRSLYLFVSIYECRQHLFLITILSHTFCISHNFFPTPKIKTYFGCFPLPSVPLFIICFLSWSLAMQPGLSLLPQLSPQCFVSSLIAAGLLMLL